MKLKHLSTEYEYFTPKFLILGLIQLVIVLISLFDIWTTYVQNNILIYTQIWALQIFSHFSRFFHGISTISPPK